MGPAGSHRISRPLIAGVFAVAVAGCTSADEVVYRDGLVATPTSSGEVDTTSTTSSVVVPATTTAEAPRTITIERAWSPQNALAEISGIGAVTSDPVTVDGRDADVESFDVLPDGSFVVRVRILDEGAHTVCVGTECSRVFTRAVDADTPEEVDAKIAEARTVAASIFDGENVLDGWTIVTAGPQAGVGGRSDADSRTITLHANRDRSVDEFVVTILHEWAHAVDAERLTDDDRLAFRRLRGYPDDVAWRATDVHTLESWSMQPGEDFAEVLVAAWTEGGLDHAVRTVAPTGRPGADTLAAVRALAEID